jgi:hypothetical protein
MNKLMKTSSVKEPFTFKSAAYRSWFIIVFKILYNLLEK